MDGANTDLEEFRKYLLRNNLSENTMASYVCAVTQFYKKHNIVTKTTLLAFKAYLMEEYKPNTVNVRIQAMNKYLDYKRKSCLKMKCIRIQQKHFLENVISNEDYKLLCKKLKKDEKYVYYFIVKYMACTGARISEVVKFKTQHIIDGMMDLYSKGGKMRRLYIPTRLQNETLKWLKQAGIEDGYIFRNKNNIQISERGISKEIKNYAKKQNCFEIETIYPHSFRHRFALNFIEANPDLTLLADILGHSSIETTKIYTRMTSRQQKAIIEKTVTWL